MEKRKRSVVVGFVFFATVMTALAGVPGASTNAPDPPDPTGWNTAVVNPQTGVRPLLVVLMEFTDLAHQATLTPAFIRNQIFGPRPSMNDFYLETSYNQFSFSDKGNWAWITAYNDPGTMADESTRAYWAAFVDACCNGGTFQRWGLKSLDVAGFNFAPLDFNNDGKVTFGQEVAYLLIDANAVDAFGGAMRGMPAGLTLDGKTIEGVSCGVSAGTPWITLYAHELAHQSSWGGPQFLTDYYGIIPEIIGSFTLMGFSGAGSAPPVPLGPHHLDPFSKLKLGWYSGTGVTTDGFYDIANAETTGTAFVLYDPAHGNNEYFMVENRWKGTSYDNTDALIGPLPGPFAPQGAAQDIPDEGLLIWHVDETRDWNGSMTGGYAKVDLIRRVVGSDSQAAFDGGEFGYYDWWDGSAPENAKWYGGTNSKTGVWCVSPKAATMRAWLDVPGPGVLICPSAPLAASAIPGSPATINVPLRNTGDAPDTFSISVSAPSDVTVTLPSPVTVASKAATTVAVQLTPVRACTTGPGPRSVTITAASTINLGVMSSVMATLTVLPFGEPVISLSAVDNDVEPGETATYDLSVLNNGNVVDTVSLAYAFADFGTTYRALPTAISLSWVVNGLPAPSSPCGPATMVTIQITVPPDWAGMEDATYDFTVTATSSITPDSDTAAGQLIVRATPLSMMLYVKVEIMNLQADVAALPPSDVRDGLMDKATAALNKVTQALDRYMLGDDPPASNLFGTTQNILEAFVHLTDAQRGKVLTIAQADSLATQAQQIIDDLDAILALI